MNNDKTKALTTLILTIFFGWFGIYRLLKGQTGLFVLWLLTCGLFGVGWIVDIIFAIIDYMDADKRTAPQLQQVNKIQPVKASNTTVSPKASFSYVQHYLKDFSHRPDSKEYYTKTEAEQLAPSYLKIVEECTKIVNSTKDHRTFFMRYDMLICYLVELQKMKCYVKFTGKDISVFLNEVLSTRDEQIKLFINRRYETAKRNIEYSQNKKVKFQQYNFYNSAIKEIECELSESNLLEAAKLGEKLKSLCDETIDQTQKRMNDEVMQINLENAKEFDTDLVEAGYFRGCCGECAKYRKRWFSISGNDKRFPKMPVDYGCTCSGIDFSPVIYGVSEPVYSDEIDDIIEFSNRPFIDDRDDEEIKLYQYDRDRHIFEEVRERDRLLFEKMQKEIPDFPFKSFNSYRRTSKDKIKQYAETAKKYGFNILYSEEEEAAIARYLLNKKELGL
ncbi:MAG: NINE protein [Ruminococcus sp.]|nr:NINE protein [Ruminococcus sp.]